MLVASDLKGIMAMMPAFATPDAASLDQAATVDAEKLRAGVDRIIRDGIDVIATTGSFGEFHTLLPEEFETLTHATVDAVRERVPLFIGCTSLHPREVLRKMEVARQAGADGVLIGVPFYFPSTVDNAVRFLHEMADRFPSLAIMVYHNPTLHNVTLPVGAFARIAEKRNIVAMKDSHRTTPAFLQLSEILSGRISVFVSQAQYHPYAQLGAAGCWSIEAWMGPWPLLRLRDAILAGDTTVAARVTREIMPTGGGWPDLSWRETAMKIAVQYAGYCDPGPLRPPFVEVPQNVLQAARARARYWVELSEQYRPSATGAGGMRAVSSDAELVREEA